MKKTKRLLIPVLCLVCILAMGLVGCGGGTNKYVDAVLNTIKYLEDDTKEIKITSTTIYKVDGTVRADEARENVYARKDNKAMRKNKTGTNDATETYYYFKERGTEDYRVYEINKSGNNVYESYSFFPSVSYTSNYSFFLLNASFFEKADDYYVCKDDNLKNLRAYLLTKASVLEISMIASTDPFELVSFGCKISDGKITETLRISTETRENTKTGKFETVEVTEKTTYEYSVLDITLPALS